MPVLAPKLSKFPQSKEFPQFDFSGGENTRDDATSIADNEFTKLLNVRITKQRAVERRGGTTSYGTVTTSDTTSEITGMFEYYDANDAQVVLRTTWNGSAGKLQKLSSGTWTTISGVSLTSGNYPFFATFPSRSGNSIITNQAATAGTNFTLTTSGLTADAHAGRAITITAGTGVNQTRIIQGNTATTVTVTDRWDTNPDATSTFSIYAVTDCCFVSNGVDDVYKYDSIQDTATDMTQLKKYRGVVVHKNKLFGFGGTGQQNDTIWWSPEGIADDQPKLYYQEIYTTTGDAITMLHSLTGGTGDRLIIQKRGSTHAMTGDAIENFSIFTIDTNVGCLAPFSMQEYNGTLYWLSARGIESSDGAQVNPIPISDKIRPTVQAWSDSLRQKAYGQIFNQRYYLAVGQDSSSSSKDSVWVYDLIFQGWTHDTGYNPNCWAVIHDSNKIPYLYFGSSRRVTGKSYQAETGTDDNGTNITMQVISKKTALGNAALRKSFDKAYYVIPSTSAAESVTVEVQIDDNGFMIVDTFPLSSNPLTLPFTLPAVFGSSVLNSYRRWINSQGYYMQHRFTNVGSNETTRIIGYTIMSTPQSLI